MYPTLIAGELDPSVFEVRDNGRRIPDFPLFYAGMLDAEETEEGSGAGTASVTFRSEADSFFDDDWEIALVSTNVDFGERCSAAGKNGWDKVVGDGKVEYYSPGGNVTSGCPYCYGSGNCRTCSGTGKR